MTPTSTVRWFLYSWLRQPLVWALLAVSAVLGFAIAGEQLRYLVALLAAASALGQLRDGEWLVSRQAPALRLRTEAVTLSASIFLAGGAATLGSVSRGSWGNFGLTWLTVLGLALLILRLRASKAVASLSLVILGWAIPLVAEGRATFDWLREASPPSLVHVLPALGLVLASFLLLRPGAELRRG